MESRKKLAVDLCSSVRETAFEFYDSPAWIQLFPGEGFGPWILTYALVLIMIYFFKKCHGVILISTATWELSLDLRGAVQDIWKSSFIEAFAINRRISE